MRAAAAYFNILNETVGFGEREEIVKPKNLGRVGNALNHNARCVVGRRHHFRQQLDAVARLDVRPNEFQVGRHYKARGKVRCAQCDEDVL